MANVRCPMCSEINTPDAGTCVACGARLKPVRSRSAQAPDPTPKDDQGDDAGEDWLSSLRLGDNDQESAREKKTPVEPSSPEPAPTTGSPDWLSRIRERARMETDESTDQSESEAEDPDWMKDLRDGTDFPARFDAPVETDSVTGTDLPDSAESSSDLLSRLPGAVEEPQLDDWLRSYPDQIFSPTNPTPDESPSEAFQPQSDQQLGTPAQDSQGEGEEEWINKLSAWQTGSTNEPRELESLPDWMNDELAAPSSPAGEADSPGWINGEEKEPSIQPEEDQISGWLRDVPSETAPDEPADLPDWLSSAPDTAADQTAGARDTAGSASSGDGSLPDWFSSFDTPDTQDALENGQKLSSDAAGSEKSYNDLPDWLEEESQPETLSAQDPVEDPAAWEPAAAEPLSAGPANEEPPGDLPQDNFDWLSQLDEKGDEELVQGESAPSEQPVEPISAQPFSAEESPEWLRDFASQAPAAGDAVPPLIGMEESEVAQPGDEIDRSFTSVELPDWLSEESSSSDAASVSAKASEPASEELTRADLPEWVKEMRPIESVIPGEPASAETNQHVEKAGPLAGLRGVLPAEEQISRYRKPPVYSAKLRVSEKQRSQSSLLDSIVTQESQPLLIVPERSHAPRVIARILVALLFLVVLAGLRAFPLGLQPSPMLTPPELRDMFNQIDRATSQSAPVLLAVDYEPGRSGEMYYASSPVIEHLMAKNARIVVLSTVPTGPALAQRLLVDSARDLNEKTNQIYDLGVQTLNLGYLPGGTISLLEFAQLPSRAAPASLEGNFDIWNQSFLQDVKDLTGFSQVIVLTDSAETGRAWVEQVQPLMGNIPLYMVTSAQAAPLLMPYVQSQQINGMVNGLLGGVIYGQWRQVDTPAGIYWESYQVGILLAVLLMLIGGLYSVIVALTKRKGKAGA
ncbi:MAG: hypothetical protein IH586_13165 [Anaerolineaceae bacterium]|nr:hypothetical protein [Anaerolineaceae bacterium]